MGDSESKFTPGFEPSRRTKPDKEENFGEDGVLVAYQRAIKYINEKPKRSYCTIGPGDWLRYYRTETKAQLKVTPIKKNIILCYHEDLDIKFPKGVEPDKITATISD